MIKRMVGTAVSVFVYGWIMMIYNPVATLATAAAAGDQFNNSDSSYLRSVWTMNFFSSVGLLLAFALFVVLVVIWFKPARDLLKRSLAILTILVVASATLMGSAQSSYAFFEKTDRTEIIPVLPNWSAFWIPSMGANEDTQKQMDSQAYLEENKVSQKYFQVPHAKLTGSAGTSMFSGYDYYVNTGSLILVDRTRYSREWVDATDRGTSTEKQGFPCQTKEGINIVTGVSIGSYVTEADAATFLYNFGVASTAPYKPTGDIDLDGSAVFQSVYYGRSLQEVMDDVGRKKVQTLVCNEIGVRTFEQANETMIEIMKTVQTGSTTYFKSVGITLDFIGWGDSFQFDVEVQNAVNREYVSRQDEVIASRLEPYAEIIKALAVAQSTRAFGDKTDGKLPQTYVGMTPEITGILGNLMRSVAAPAVPIE